MASLQQVVEQLASLAASDSNATGDVNATSPASVPRGSFDLIRSTSKILFSASALRDWAVLFVIGSFLETTRRLLSALWYWLISSFFITAIFEDEDVSYQWIMHWLSKQPSWKGARNVQISTSNFDLRPMQFDSNEELDAHSRKVTYLPAVSESYTLWYHFRWMQATRAIESHHGGWFTKETLTISILTCDRGALARILREAKSGYIEAQKDKIAVFVSDRYNSIGGWRELATRPKRPLNSIILDPGITELALEDVQDFLSSKEWYAERGIPFRRGYLLYGAPGSGKTSLIHSIAGELGLNVYIVSLSRSGLDDTGLAELISALPERCIALMEDIDAAFHHGLNRESAPGTDSPAQPPDGPEHPQHDMPPPGPPVPTGNRVSLSGLLNALDGIGAQEGRVLFATTNKYSSLDPALCRPGRMDLHIEFKLASRFQAEELFKQFYAPSSSASGPARGSESANEHGKCENGDAAVNASEKGACSKDLIDLCEPQPHAAASSPPTSPSPPSLPPSSPTPPPTPPVPSKPNDIGPRPTFGTLHRARGPILSLDQITTLAAQFALAVPERQLSMASLQGFLMMHKTRPFDAVVEVGPWVEKEIKEAKEAKEVDAAG